MSQSQQIAVTLARMATVLTGGKALAIAIITREETSLGSTLGMSISTRFPTTEDAITAFKMLLDENEAIRFTDPEEFERIVNQKHE